MVLWRKGSSDRFRAWLKNAFALSDPDASWKPEDDELLDRVAQWVANRRMAAPVSLFLETYRPFGYLGSQAMVMAEPFVDMALQTFPGLLKQMSTEEYSRLILLMERRETVRRLLDKIAKAELEHGSGQNG